MKNKKNGKVLCKNIEKTLSSHHQQQNFLSIEYAWNSKMRWKYQKKWEGVNESYIHPVTDQITVLKKTYTYMPILLTKLFQSLCIVHLNENNLLQEVRVYEQNPSYKIYESSDEMKVKHTTKGRVIRGIRQMNIEDFYFYWLEWIWKKELSFIRLSSMTRKDVGIGAHVVPQWRFIITWIMIILYLVTKKGWICQYKIISSYIQCSLRRIQMNYFQFFSIGERWDIFMATMSK